MSHKRRSEGAAFKKAIRIMHAYKRRGARMRTRFICRLIETGNMEIAGEYQAEVSAPRIAGYFGGTPIYVTA